LKASTDGPSAFKLLDRLEAMLGAFWILFSQVKAKEASDLVGGKGMNPFRTELPVPTQSWL
jgi:hypothetical protein